MVYAFFCTDPETDFPCLADLQSALLNESGSDDALITACESLLTAALQDPGVVVMHIDCRDLLVEAKYLHVSTINK